MTQRDALDRDAARTANDRSRAVTALVQIVTLLVLTYGLVGLVLLIRWSWSW